MEVNPSQSEEESCDFRGSSSLFCSSEKCSHGYHTPAGTNVWTEHLVEFNLPAAVPCTHEHHPESGLLDLHCSSPMPGLADSSHYGSVPAAWITNEPIPCAEMPGEPLPVAIICAPELMDSQEFQDGQADVVVGSLSGDAQMVTSHCQPGPILHTLAPPPDHRDTGPTQGKEMNMLVASNQYHQTASPVYCETTAETASLQLKAVQTDGASCKPVKSKKPCNCVKSQCLKLYCDCFANLEMCRNCNCCNCYNNEEYEKQRLNAIQVCLSHNPSAFKQMISSGKSGEVKGGYNKGCKCKRSGCLKKYCKCYEANIMCTASCECVGCVNSHDSTKGETRFGDCSETSPSEKIHNEKENRCLSVITPSVVEAVCGCLLSRAQLAERDATTLTLAERAVLEEFGQCLAQISQAMFKPSA